MNKTQIKEWVEKQRRIALDIALTQYRDSKTVHNTKVYEEIGLYELASTVQSDLDKIHAKVEKWKSNLNKEGIARMDYYGSTTYKLYDYIKGENATLNQLISCDFKDNTKALEKLMDDYNSTVKEINRNYNNVINNIKTLKTAKLCAEYLEQLGFDLTELKEEQPVTALVAQVDRGYLFIGGGIRSDR